jgi:DNA polymerase III subunit alpha, Gram-positive type
MDERSVYNIEFCALDIETTGTNPYGERIVEIGMVNFTPDQIIAEYSSLVNPGKPIPYNVQIIHGISDEMVSDSPAIETILPDIFDFIGDRPFVIHNARFDLSFVEMECRRSGKLFEEHTSFDTVTLSRKVFPNMRNHKLGNLCEEMHIDLKNHHRALADATACMEIFRRCLFTADPERTWTLKDLTHYNPVQNRPVRDLAEKMRRGGVLAVGKHSVIRYIDSEGNVTERKILPKRIYRQGKQTVIYAYCYLRGEDRFFKSGRIEEIVE